MNKTNILHALIAAAMMAPFVLAGEAVAGAAFAIGWFVSREHAHRQVDIFRVTGVPVPKQNPLDALRGWSLDAKLDALFPAAACLIILVVWKLYGLTNS